MLYTIKYYSIKDIGTSTYYNRNIKEACNYKKKINALFYEFATFIFKDKLNKICIVLTTY